MQGDQLKPSCNILIYLDLFGGPRGDRTPDLLIANKTEGESQQAPEGLSPSQDDKKPEGETR